MQYIMPTAHLYGQQKALLLDKGVNASTQSAVIQEFDNHYVNEGLFQFPTSFSNRVLQINKYEPSREFAEAFLLQATAFSLEAATRREELKTVNQ